MSLLRVSVEDSGLSYSVYVSKMQEDLDKDAEMGGMMGIWYLVGLGAVLTALLCLLYRVQRATTPRCEACGQPMKWAVTYQGLSAGWRCENPWCPRFMWIQLEE